MATLRDGTGNTAAYANADFTNGGHDDDFAGLGGTGPRFIQALEDVTIHGRDIFKGVSTTSLAIATGSTSFTATPDRPWVAGMYLRAESQADSANYMEGSVTSYDAATGALVLAVTATGGSGTHADWTFRPTTPPPQSSFAAIGDATKVAGSIPGTPHTLLSITGTLQLLGGHVFTPEPATVTVSGSSSGTILTVAAQVFSTNNADDIVHFVALPRAEYGASGETVTISATGGASGGFMLWHL